MRTGKVLIGAAIGLAGIWLLTKSAVGKEGIDLQPYGYVGPLRYFGPKKTFKAALGECYNVIFTIDVYDEFTGDYVPPSDPEHDKIETGAICMVQVQAPCTLYNFEWA